MTAAGMPTPRPILADVERLLGDGVDVGLPVADKEVAVEVEMLFIEVEVNKELEGLAL